MFVFGEGGSRLLSISLCIQNLTVSSHLIVYAYNNIAINLFVKRMSGYVHNVFIFFAVQQPKSGLGRLTVHLSKSNSDTRTW